MSQMFDYGRSMSDSSKEAAVYKYYYFEENLQPGSYPVDNFLSIDTYDVPKMTLDGEVYGEISYSSPLSASSIVMYELADAVLATPKKEPPKKEVIKKETEKPIASHAKTNSYTNMIYMNGVPRNRIYSTKNPKWKTISIPYEKADDGFAKIIIATDKLFGSNGSLDAMPDQATFNVNLGTPTEFKELNFKKDGTYTTLSVPNSLLSGKYGSDTKLNIVASSRTSKLPSAHIIDEGKDDGPVF